MLKIGDMVKVIRRTTDEEAENTHCGWIGSNMDKNIGKIFKVHDFDKKHPTFAQLEDGRDKEDGVDIGYWYHINCLQKIEKEVEKFIKREIIISGITFQLPESIIKLIPKEMISNT